MAALDRDLRDSVRSLTRNRRFVSVALLAGALGIGANTAIFSVVWAVLLKPLPYHEPERLVSVWAAAPDRGLERTSVSVARYEAIAASVASLEAVAAYTADSVRLTGAGEAVELRALRCSSTFLRVLGVAPAVGSDFSASDDLPGGPRSVILTHEAWQNTLGANRAALGSTLVLDGTPHEVIGILPAGFTLPGTRTDVLVTRVGEPGFLTAGAVERGAAYLDVVARLAPGKSLAEAKAELEVLAGQDRRDGFLDANLAYRTGALHEQTTAATRPVLIVLLLAVSLILLAACANIAGLGLARAASRRRDMAIRAAIGASRVQLLRRSLTESLLLGAAAGLVGLLIARLVLRVLLAAAGDAVPRVEDVRLDGMVLAFTLGVTVLTSVLFGILPALSDARAKGVEALGQGRRSSPGRRAGRLQNTLVVVEIALSTLLLVGAGLLFRTLDRLGSVDLGFVPDNVLVARIKLPSSTQAEPERIRQFFTELRQSVAQIDGVTSVGAAETLPLAGGTLQTPLAIAGRQLPEVGDRDLVYLDTVSPGYFETMSIPLLRGRLFAESDDSSVPIRIIVNQQFSVRYFEGGDPTGEGVILGRSTKPYEIIGVVGNVRETGADTAPPEMIYLTSNQRATTSMSLVVRSADVPAASLASAVRARVRAIDADQPVSEITTMRDVVAGAVGDRRLLFRLFALFALVAFALAATGIYAVVSNAAGNRTREVGVRRALGAETSDVLRLVVGHGMRLWLAGVTIGLAAVVAASRTMERFLFGVAATDPSTLVLVSLTLLLVAAGASFVPARRAAKADPLVALREE